jgi:hypothetical protein
MVATAVAALVRGCLLTDGLLGTVDKPGAIPAAVNADLFWSKQ